MRGRHFFTHGKSFCGRAYRRRKVYQKFVRLRLQEPGDLLVMNEQSLDVVLCHCIRTILQGYGFGKLQLLCVVVQVLIPQKR